MSLQSSSTSIGLGGGAVIDQVPTLRDRPDPMSLLQTNSAQFNANITNIVRPRCESCHSLPIHVATWSILHMLSYFTIGSMGQLRAGRGSKESDKAAHSPLDKHPAGHPVWNPFAPAKTNNPLNRILPNINFAHVAHLVWQTCHLLYNFDPGQD